MVIKVYISGISGNKEVKKRQQRVTLILDSKGVQYELLDIAEPNMEEAKEYMQNNSKLMGGTISDPNPRHPLPPQIFNDDEYCGDYDAFDMANELDEMEKFLKLSPDEVATSNAEIKLSNGEIAANGETVDEEEVKEVDLDIHENGNNEISTSEDVPEVTPKEKSPTPAKDDDAGDIVEPTDEQDLKDEKSSNKDEDEETEKSEEA